MSDRYLVFVYGTLKRGGSNHRHLSGQEFCGTARTVAGFRLIHLGAYPGIVAHPENGDTISGEVWAVDAACLARLDELEGVNDGLYRRTRIALQPPFADTEVDTYFYLPSTDGSPHIPGGDWTHSGV